MAESGGGGTVEAFVGIPDLQDTACRFCEKPVGARDQRSDLVTGETGWRTPVTMKEQAQAYPAHLRCWVELIAERERVRRMTGR